MPEPKKKRVDKDDVVIGVYYGKYHPTKLPENLYYSTAQCLNEGVKFGFVEGAKDMELLSELETNVYMFSAAKVFNQTLEMSGELLDENGDKRSFKDFKSAAEDIYKKYNGEDFDGDPRTMGDWLKTEYDTAIAESRMASKWNEIEKNKALFPNLIYKTTGDDRVCEICGPLDGIILPVNDSFWDGNYPPNHFRCYCTVIQVSESEAESQGGVDDWEDIKKDVQSSEANKNPMFSRNAGKDKTIFKDTGRYKHPYFSVPLQYREFAKNNFNLPIL